MDGIGQLVFVQVGICFFTCAQPSFRGRYSIGINGGGIVLKPSLLLEVFDPPSRILVLLVSGCEILRYGIILLDNRRFVVPFAAILDILASEINPKPQIL